MPDTFLHPGTTQHVLDRLFPKPNPYVKDPAKWVREKLGEDPWSKQREIAQSVVDNRHTAVQSCHGIGKSYLAGRIAAWWIATRPVGEAFVVTSAPTAPQVKAILWREIKRAHKKGELEGYITEGEIPEWKIGGELVGFGRKPADYTDPQQASAAFQGIHARYVLVVLDEAGGIPAWLWDATETLVTNNDSRVLAIGNPDDPTSGFAKKCQYNSGWNVIKVGAWDTPAFTGEKVDPNLLELLISKQWVEERRRAWGENSPIYTAKVKGEFPDVSDDTLLPPLFIKEAQYARFKPVLQGKFGVDVARYGDDETAIYSFRGGRVRKVRVTHKQDTMQTAGLVMHLLKQNQGMLASIDVNGLGAGVYDRCKARGHEVLPFNSSNRAKDPKRFKNRRAEAYWHLRELAEAGALDLPPEGEDDDLIAQLGSIKWSVDGQGRIVVESKEDMKKRGLPSPDRADAAVMAAEDPPLIEVVEEELHSLTSDLLDRPM